MRKSLIKYKDQRKMMAKSRNQSSEKSDRGSYFNDKVEHLWTNLFHNRLPRNFEAIVLSGQPEQSNAPNAGETINSEFSVNNDKRYYFVRVRPLKTAGVFIPSPFEEKELSKARKLINMHPLAYIAVNDAVHPPSHGDVYLCRYTRRDRLGIALIKRQRSHNKVIDTISNRGSHQFHNNNSPTLLSNAPSQETQPPGSSDYKEPPSNTSPTLADQTPVITAVNYGQPEIGPVNNGMACSVFTAIWALNQMGKIPPELEWPRWQNWQRLDPTFWSKAQLTEASGGGEGSIINIVAYQEKLGGSYGKYDGDYTTTSAPVLTEKRWHIVQRWTRNPQSPEEFTTGHSYLVYWDGGEKVRYVDSSFTTRYRDFHTPSDKWWTKGSEETVLTLPFGGS